MNLRIIISLYLILPAVSKAQSNGFSEGKNLATLRAAVYNKTHYSSEKVGFCSFSKSTSLAPAALNPVFLPQWTAEDLPFFCKIEHDWGRKSRIPFKFRLGSVEYVDWLEGK